MRMDAITHPSFAATTPLLSLADLAQRKQALWNTIINNSKRLNFKINSTNNKVQVLGFQTYDDFVRF